jgi:tripeptide aminopeptidase
MNPAIADLMEVLSIQGVSTEERPVVDYLVEKLKSLGVPADSIHEDNAQSQSEYGGNAGNLIVKLDARGDHPGRPRLFCAHTDTVALCRHAKPRYIEESGGLGQIVNDNPDAALGADARTGVGVLIHIARTLCEGDMPHPPIWLLFPCQEELGLVGVRGLDLKSLQPDPPAMGFNWDTGRPETVIHSVIGTSRILMELHGKASHAGGAPEKGVSCAVAFARALAELADGGWHGLIDKPEGKGTANIGVVRGGEMTNTVIDRMTIHGDVRSHDTAFREKLVDLYVSTFEKAAATTTNVDGDSARLEWKLGPCYDAFALAEDSPVVDAASAAIRAIDLEPALTVNNGGMDANHLNAKGLSTVTLGCGQFGGHTVNEGINLKWFIKGCELGVQLATQQ